MDSGIQDAVITHPLYSPTKVEPTQNSGPARTKFPEQIVELAKVADGAIFNSSEILDGSERNRIRGFRIAQTAAAFGLAGSVFSGIFLSWTHKYTGVDVQVMGAIAAAVVGFIVARRRF